MIRKFRLYCTVVSSPSTKIEENFLTGSQVSVLAGLCFVVTFHPKFRTPSFRPYRAVMYAALGLSALVFVSHGVGLHGWTEQNRRMSLNWMILMASLNLTGAAFYAARVGWRRVCKLWIVNLS